MGLGYPYLKEGTSLQVLMPFIGETKEVSYLYLKITGTQDSAPTNPDGPIAMSPTPNGLTMPFVPVPGQGPMCPS